MVGRRTSRPVLDITLNAPIQVQGKGAEGSGGFATFEAHRGLILGDIDATAGRWKRGRHRRHRLVLAQSAGRARRSTAATAASPRWRAAAP